MRQNERSNARFLRDAADLLDRRMNGFQVRHEICVIGPRSLSDAIV
jgi:hypothetical protein